MDIKGDELVRYYKQKYPLTFIENALWGDSSLDKRYEAAWEIAKKAAGVLKSDYDAQKVAVFGSLTNRSLFTRWSDIDLAVWGIPDKKFYAAVGAVTSLTTKFKIDLVDAMECRASLYKAIKNGGMEI
ncbi:MAG: nucleotidyltransferase family protein [Natronincolaceae bacterium]|jgi:predicted nucleotidyltransferase|nr:nucleotidyltransferase domain-containing protein [Bacillota bacterium]NLK90569.1 nucleotidyltransferase domain-containing protein [Clostridiales bacterium]